MANLVIKDLSLDLELDRKAMSAIYGGSKSPLPGKLGAQRGYAAKDSLLGTLRKRQQRLR